MLVRRLCNGIIRGSDVEVENKIYVEAKMGDWSVVIQSVTENFMILSWSYLSRLHRKEVWRRVDSDMV